MNDKLVIGALIIIFILLTSISSFFSSSRNHQGDQALSQPLQNPQIQKPTVRINNQIFQVEIADSAVSRARGLSSRDSLAENQGMLFIFAKPGNYGFWMKDMKFPIDIIWLKENRIVGFSKNLQPQPEKSPFALPIYYPPGPVDKVLEINAGLVKIQNFKTGDLVEIK